jgi:hypothetical protein
VTATQDILTGDTVQSNQPVGTTLALIEQGLKTFTAIVKRIHRALKHELGVLYRLNARYLNPQTYFTFQDVQGVVAQEDYARDDMTWFRSPTRPWPPTCRRWAGLSSSCSSRKWSSRR